MWLKCHVTFWCGHFILSHHLAKSWGHWSCESGDITFFICHVTTWSKCRVTLWVGCSILSYHLAKFGGHEPCDNGDITFFLFVTWPRNQSVVRLCGSGSFILSYLHRPCESGGITFFICHMTTWLCWCGPFILSDHPARFGGHRFYRSGDNRVYDNSSNSNSNSNAKVYKWPTLLIKKIYETWFYYGYVKKVFENDLTEF